MPSDLLGTYVVMETPQGRRTFEFQKGPIFANLVLADQINRGTPKTQSALLEAMEGQEVTVARETFQLPQPFLVVATQNPVEMEGTFPLPEPQLDRFLLKVARGSARPGRNGADPRPHDRGRRDRWSGRRPTGSDCWRCGRRPEPFRSTPTSAAASSAWWPRPIPTMPTPPSRSAVSSATRASPRGAQAVVTAAKIRAAAAARSAVSDADVLAVVPAALRHRLILNFEGQTEAVSPDRLIEAILEAIR